MHFEIEGRDSIVNSTKKFLKIFEKLTSENCLNNITNTVSKNEMQNIIYLHSGPEKDMISDVIISECIKAESVSAGSASLILNLLSLYIKSDTDNPTRKDRIARQKELRDEISQASLKLSKYTRKAEKDDIFQIVNEMDISENLKNLMTRLILKYEIGEKIEILKSHTRESYIEKRVGNFLPIEVPQISLKNGSKWEFESPGIILVDGIIERVSQIHHLLEKASSTKDPYVLICRKASKEVRETVDINFVRETLNLIVVETDFNQKYHHLFRDMSAIFNCDFINIQMGDTLSSRIEKFKFIVDRVKIDNSGITFYHNNENREKIREYIVDMREFLSRSKDIDSETASEIEKSIDFRSRFLSSSSNILRIGSEDLDENNSEISKLDAFTRSIPDIGTFGIIDLSKVRGKDRILKTLSNIKDKRVITQKQVFHSLVVSFKIYEMINKAEKLFTIKK